MRAALFVAVLALAGAAAATFFLHRAAQAALGRVLEERLRGAGQSVAVLLGEPRAGSRRLKKVMDANSLDGAYLLDRSLTVVEDATGEAGRRADLLRIDPDRAQRAFAGSESIARSYSVGEVPVETGYFPLPREGGIQWVLALEAGRPFAAEGIALRRARDLALGLTLLVAMALGLGAARFGRAQERAARGEVIQRMAAMAAHEIRNPLGIIRGSVELLRERPGLAPRDREALQDVLGEVERLRQLTEDFLTLGADRPLQLIPLHLPPIVAESAAALGKEFPEVRVRQDLGALPPVLGDPARLRQVFGNLLSNAAQAQPGGVIELSGSFDRKLVRVRVRDSGPGIPAGLRARLFDPFVTTKPTGVGLGLAISRRLIERQGGTLLLLDGASGATFEVCLQRSAE